MVYFNDISDISDFSDLRLISTTPSTLSAVLLVTCYLLHATCYMLHATHALMHSYSECCVLKHTDGFACIFLRRGFGPDTGYPRICRQYKAFLRLSMVSVCDYAILRK